MSFIYLSYVKIGSGFFKTQTIRCCCHGNRAAGFKPIKKNFNVVN